MSEFLMKEGDIEIINKRMRVDLFEKYDPMTKKILVLKWRKKSKHKPVLTVRDISMLHNDGDQIMQQGIDY